MNNNAPFLFRAIRGAVRRLGRTWFTGAIYLLAFAGYSFYGILWAIRFMQTNKKIQLAVVSFFGILLIAAYGCWWLLMPMGAPGHIVEMKVTSGASLRSIAGSLQKQKVIRWAPALLLWMKAKHTDNRIQAGAEPPGVFVNIFQVARL